MDKPLVVVVDDLTIIIDSSGMTYVQGGMYVFMSFDTVNKVQSKLGKLATKIDLMNIDMSNGLTGQEK